MKTTVDCYPCTINQCVRICNTLNIDEDVKYELVIKIMDMLKEEKLTTPSPFLTRHVWKMITEHIGIKDPYKDLKTFYNKEMLNMEREMQYIIDRASDRFMASMRVAIAGNLIDFGVMNELSHSIIVDKIRDVENGELAIDHCECLRESLGKAKTLLYIGDNCGEIVFDKMFIEQIKKEFPELYISFAVRGFPIINDVTREDAIFTGIDKVADVIIDTGDFTPGVNLEHSSPEFVNVFNSVDVIISKGQGNFESLATVERENLFFLFMAKCHVVANYLGIKPFQYVCRKKIID